MIATYWRAETYQDGELANIEFPRRATKEEAIEDARNHVCGMCETDLRGLEVGVAEWTTDGESPKNTGRWQLVVAEE